MDLIEDVSHVSQNLTNELILFPIVPGNTVTDPEHTHPVPTPKPNSPIVPFAKAPIPKHTTVGFHRGFVQ